MSFGFLNADEPRLFEADLYIAAMGRSGSTWLANLFTVPPTHWLMIEPWFANGVFARFIHEKAADFGISVDKEFWMIPRPQLNHDSVVERYRNFLAPELAKLSRWGAKEVRGDFHQPTIETINPKHIIILVRNMRDVVLSLLEKWHMQGRPEERGKDWIEGYCIASANSLLDVHAKYAVAGSDKCRVVKYETLRDSSSGELRSLEEWLDWPMSGDPFSYLDKFGRGYEIERHSGNGEYKREIDEGEYQAFVAQVIEKTSAYQRTFGY